jgi:hypothetical protein
MCFVHMIFYESMKERGMMSRQLRAIQLPLVGTILLGLLVGIYMVVRKRFAKKDPSARIIKHSVGARSDDTLKYWTADKMRGAKAVDLPNVDALEQGKGHSRRSPHTSSQHQD